MFIYREGKVESKRKIFHELGDMKGRSIAFDTSKEIELDRNGPMLTSLDPIPEWHLLLLLYVFLFKLHLPKLPYNTPRHEHKENFRRCVSRETNEDE